MTKKVSKRKTFRDLKAKFQAQAIDRKQREIDYPLAYQEAGHAVAVWVLKQKIITMRYKVAPASLNPALRAQEDEFFRRNPDCDAAVCHDTYSGSAKALISLCGAFAEAIFTPIYEDHADVVCASLRTEFNDDEIAERLAATVDRAATMVGDSRFQHCVRTLAEVVYRRRRLDGYEAEKIISEAYKETPGDSLPLPTNLIEAARRGVKFSDPVVLDLPNHS